MRLVFDDSRPWLRGVGKWLAGALLATGVLVARPQTGTAADPGVSPQAVSAAPAPTPPPETAEPPPPAAVPGQYVVRFRPATNSARKQAALDTLGAGVRLVPRGLRRAVRLQDTADSEFFDQLALIEVADTNAVAGIIRRLERLPEVLYLEPNYLLHLAAEPRGGNLPNDFNLGKQWGLLNTGQHDGVVGADIDAPEAWQLTTGDPTLKVAVIDTGIDYYHPDLAANLWTNPGEIPGNGLDDDQNGYIDDEHGYDFVSDDSDPMDDQIHGTHVAGILGAVGNNRIGVSGVCWGVSLMAIKAFDENGNGTVFDAIQAIGYAVANGARILNASWGTPDKSRALEEAIVQAQQAGRLVVAAAGNDRSDKPSYPAALANVVSVAALDPKGKRSIFSNYGPWVAVAAPGENIYSTLPNAGYDYLNGTSMATPMVAGVAALVWSRHPEFAREDVERILRNAVDPVSPDQYVGMGRLNAFKAVQVDQPLPVANLAMPSTVFGLLDIRGTAAGPRFARYALEYGFGIYPTNWTEIAHADTPVQDGVLRGGFSTAVLDEGICTFRLTVTDLSGQTARARATVTVRNVHLASPAHNDVIPAGTRVEVRGTAFGPGRRYTLEYGVGWHPASWSTAGLSLPHDGTEPVVAGLLGTWDTSQLAPQQFYELRLSLFEGERLVGQWQSHLVYLEGQLRPGWPQYVPVEGAYPTNDWRSLVVADLGRDGFQKVIRVDPGNAEGKPTRLLAYDFDGTLWWSRELAGGEPYTDVPVVGDLDADGFPDLLVDVGESGLLYGFGHDGSPLPGDWPVPLQARALGKTLADLDGDGYLEVIGYANLPTERAGREERQLVVFDHRGRLLRRWSLPHCTLDTDTPRITPAVGNFDDLPDLEIATVYDCDRLAVFSLRKADGPLWTAAVEGSLVASPVVGDLNHDGQDEIIIASLDNRSVGQHKTHGGVYAFDRRGRRLRGWPVLIDESFNATPALADFDGDGTLEIVVPSFSSQKIHLLRAYGFEADGWPVKRADTLLVNSDPVIGDIDGDGRLDVVMVCPGKPLLSVVGGDLAYVGGVKAWDFHGRPIDLNPHPSVTALVMESGGGTRNKGWPVTLTDLDMNGKLDLVAASIEDAAYSPDAQGTVRKQRYSLYAWELNVPYVATNLPWPGFRHDLAHTGYVAPPRYTNQPPVLLEIPNQTIRVGGAFFPIQLDRYADDPDNAPTDLRWSVEGNQELEVVIGPDRVVTVQTPAPAWAGSETLRFVAQDPGGRRGERLVVYSARTDYQPPVANDDRVSTPEDTPVEVDVLANDSDPGGGSLSVVQLGRPLHGRLEPGAGGRFTYTPAKYFSGQDSFTYTLSNGRDGMAMATVLIEITPVQYPPLAVEDYAITLEATPVLISALDNDTDPDDDPLAVVSFTQPQHGSVTLLGDSFLYTPAANYQGVDQFTYVITDGHQGQSEGTVNILVKPVNQPPVAQDQSFRLNRNTKQDLAFQATDPEGSTLTFKVVQGPEHGALYVSSTVATYYPKKGYVGPDRFTYEANDGELSSPEATVTLEMLDRNNPPEAEAQSIVAKPDRPRALTLLATDPDDDPLSFEILRPPAHGSLAGSSSNYTYSAAAGFLGEDQFAFLASDGLDRSPERVVTIKVTLENTAPQARDAAPQVRLNTPAALKLTATDLEGDSLTYSIVTHPANGQISGDPPELLYTPVQDFVGPDRFSFKASDGELESGVATVSLSVVYPNHPPESTNQTFTLIRDQPGPIALQLVDADNNPLRCAILKGPRHGRLVGLGTNYTYRPKPGFTGSDSFTYKAWDGYAYSQVAQVTLYVRTGLPEIKPSFDRLERLDNGQVRLRLRAQPGKMLLLQSSADLAEWITIASLYAEDGTASYLDPSPAASPVQFYRVFQP